MTAVDLARALGGRPQGDGWVARCPAHVDRTPSLAIADGRDGRVVVRCHAGCAQAEVIAALRDRGLWPPRRPETAAELAERVRRDDDRAAEHRAYRARWRGAIADVDAARRAGDRAAEDGAIARLDEIEREWRAWRAEQGDPSARVARAVADLWSRWRTEDALARVRGAADAA